MAQGHNENIRTWFQTYPTTDSTQIQVTANLVNLNQESQFLYYLAIFGTERLTIRNADTQQKGLLALLPNDTTSIFFDWNPIQLDSTEKKIRLFLSENEFVIQTAEWSSKEIGIPEKNRDIIAQSIKPKQETSPKKKERPSKYNRPISSEKNQKIARTERQKGKETFLAKDDFEITGLVFNETRTRFGGDFYRKLNEIWTPPSGVGSYWITIRELPSPGRFTVLSIVLNNRELFQRNLIPRQGYIESLAYQTANLLNSVLKNGNYDGSLSNTDLFGSGVE